MADPKLSRGFRNRNPGNIEHNPKNKWVGLADPPLEVMPAGGTPRFARFVSHEYGIRALALLLQTYQDRHGLNTVRGIIRRWAPPEENETSSYVHAVADAMDVAPDDTLDLHDTYTMRKLVKAVIAHELGGNPYDDATITEGLRLAGLVDPAATRSNTVRTAAATAGASVVVAGGVEVLDAITQALPALSGLSSAIEKASPWAVVIGVIVVAGFFAYQRLQRVKRIQGTPEI